MRVLTLVTVGVLLAGQFLAVATAPPTLHTNASNGCTSGHAADADITGVQPRVAVNASIVSLDTDGAYDETVVRYRVTFAQPDAVANLAVKPRGGDVVGTGQFARAGAWFTAENETTTLTVHVDPRAAQFGWAFAPPPVVTYRWTSGGDQYCTYTMTERTPLTVTTTPGMNVSYAQQGVLLSPGQHVSRTVTVDGTTIRVVADANRSGPRFGPARAAAELTQVARHVDVAAATERVTVFALPASASGPAAAYRPGITPSSRTVTVGTTGGVQAAGDVWTHEYVHAVQTFEVGERMQ